MTEKHTDTHTDRHTDTHTHTQTDRHPPFSGPERPQYIQSMKMTECKKVRYKYKTIFFSKFYIDEIAMRKKRANLPMHTLQEPKLFSGTFFRRRRVMN